MTISDKNIKILLKKTCTPKVAQPKMIKPFMDENLQRVGVLTFIPETLRRLGADPKRVLAAAGLSAHGLDDPEGTIPYDALGRILTVAAEKTRCPYFALEAARQIGTQSLGLVGELARNSPNLGIALRDFAEHQHRNAHGGVAYLLTANDHAFFGYAVYQENVPGNHLICDGAARIGFNLVCELAGPGVAPALEVFLSRREPVDAKPWRDSFGVKLHFNAEQTAVCMPRRLLDLPVAGADARLRQILEERVGVVSCAGELDVVTRLRRLLRVALLSRQISGDEIAAQLGISRRTLQRKLGAHGAHFQELLDETRCEFARQLLANTRLDIGDIGVIVGYDDPSVFTRAFVRWAGMPPSMWRSSINVEEHRTGDSTEVR